MPDLYMDVDAALSEVPVNIMPLLDATDFKTIEADVNFNATGLSLIWHFITTAGAYSQTAVTPTDTGGNYDWVEQGNGMFTIEIPASGGNTINNDTEGFGWFTGAATGVLPWRGPTIGFRAAGINNALIDGAYSATRGLAGTALPDAAADAAGGVPISDAGGLDIDAKLANTNEVTAARMGALTDWINGGRLDLILDIIAADTTTDIPALIADLPTVAEFEARSIVSADYTVVTDLGVVQTGDSYAIVNGDHGLVSIQDDVDAILADTGELQTDWVNGGRLDLILDIIAADTTTDIPATLATIAGYLDTEIAAILADTGELQTDWVNGGRLDLLIDAIKTAVDLVEDILRNKMAVTDANGNTTLYADNNTDALFTVAACLTDDSTTTIRKRLE